MSAWLHSLDWLHLGLAALAILGPLGVHRLVRSGHPEAAKVVANLIRWVELQDDAQLKQAIRQAATEVGVQDELDALVQRVTGDPQGAPPAPKGSETSP